MGMIGACTILTGWVSHILKRNRQRQRRRPAQNRPPQRLDLLPNLRRLRRPHRPRARESLQRRHRIRRQTFRQLVLRNKDGGNDEEACRYQTCFDTGGSDVGQIFMDRINVIIAENESSERDKLKSQLASEPDFQVVGEARDGKECVELVTRHRPDVVLIKEDLPVLNGLAAAEQITSELPEVGVILILTGSEGQEVWHKMLRAGIKEFVTRPLVTERLVEEVRKVATIQAKAAKFAGVASAAPAVVPEGPKRQAVTVTGPRGGCGKTVIAANLAVALARVSEKIALVDLNLWGGDVAMLLDLTPKRTLGDLLPGFGGIDYDVVDSVMSKHSSGVSVLAAPLTGTFDGSTLSRYKIG